jgi:hypothetical protein
MRSKNCTTLIIDIRPFPMLFVSCVFIIVVRSLPPLMFCCLNQFFLGTKFLAIQTLWKCLNARIVEII